MGSKSFKEWPDALCQRSRRHGARWTADWSCPTEGRRDPPTYALSFHLEPRGPDRWEVRAETRARFPAVHGRLYRLLVVGSGWHVRSVRGLLDTVRRRAELRRSARGTATSRPPAGALDRAPFGRNDTGPWFRRHDEYDQA